MIINMTEQHLKAAHGIVCSLPNEFLGYFGWPSVTKMDNGVLVAAASGFRNAHICPFGRNVIFFSQDNGQTWSFPAVANDSPLDDRDSGILSLGENKLLLTWFSSDPRREAYNDGRFDPLTLSRYQAGLSRINEKSLPDWLGCWVKVSRDGGESWEKPVKVPVTTPHGPIRLKNGKLLYLGRQYGNWPVHPDDPPQDRVVAFGSSDEGASWQELGNVPLYPGTQAFNYHEPHVAELADGRLVGMIRIEESQYTPPLKEAGIVNFSLMQCESADGGRTWSTAEPLGFHGSPPHLLAHSSGTLVCVYGYREKPYGQRVMLSKDGGKSWVYHLILRDDGPDWDLGYPASVELADGSIFTVYYQKVSSPTEKCSILCSRWELPGI